MDKLNILVTGDVIKDQHLFLGEKTGTSSDKPGNQIVHKTGGASIIYELLYKMENFYEELRKKKVNEKNKGDVVTHKYLEASTISDIERISKKKELTSFIQWKKHRKVNDEDEKQWDAEYLGFGDCEEPFVQEPTTELFKNSDLIVIDDANLGYKNNKPDVEGKTVILKMSYPFCEGKLWPHLTQNAKDLITIVNLSNLRKYDVKVSKGISWEQTALDLAFELSTNSKLKTLLESKYLVVTIGSAGALYIKNGSKEDMAEFQLIFDPVFMEDEWEAENGSSVGLGAAFTAGFVRKYIEDYLEFYSEIENNDKSYDAQLDKTIKTGLNYIRTISAYGLLVNPEKANKTTFNYPFNGLQKIITGKSYFYSTCYVPSPHWSKKEDGPQDEKYLKSNDWNILEGNYFSKKLEERLQKQLDGKKISEEKFTELMSPQPYFELAREVALHGHSAIQYAPRIEVGKFISFDRNEIEKLRNIRKLMLDYFFYDEGKRPLNITIFGPPGAGKSFAVKEIARNMFDEKQIQFLEYNLSQFSESKELTGVFHSIRDVVLNGQLPIVFWDEFDSDKLKWLKSFINPMQDGFFQEEGKSHPLGKCIFFFAGGTSISYKTFNAVSPENKNDEPTINDFISKKGPDFLSRVNGYLDVLGPNRNGKADVCFPVRRAIFMRGSFRLKDEEILKMDWGLISAFLEIKEYKRGSRSLDRLLGQLKLYNVSSFVRSNLPSDEVIDMNVDYDEFIKLLYKDRQMEQFTETLAKSIHGTWMELNVKDSSFYNEYSKLNYEGRKDNIAAAWRMFDILSNTNHFKLVPAITNAPDGSDGFNKFLKKKDNIENLAKAEHEGWCDERIKNGWIKQAETRNDYLKIHPCLIEYEDLSEEQKYKDRKSILKYVEFVGNSEFMIVKQ